MIENIQDKNYIVKMLREICKSYSDIFGKVILFGSYSRNEQSETSDIDLYIESKYENMTTYKLGTNKRYREFKYQLNDVFSNQIDLLAYGGKRDIKNIKKSPLWKQIETDGIIIYDQGAKTI